MSEMLSFGPVVVSVLLAAWVALTVVILALFFFKSSDTDSVRIIIHLPEDLQKLNVQFGLLHVRDGKDQVPGAGDLINKEIPFRAVDRHGTMEATVTYSKRIGFQFKCFVDHRPYEFEQIEKQLTDAGFLDPSKGGGKPFRAWFILRDYQPYTTVDGFVNNYYYPS